MLKTEKEIVAMSCQHYVTLYTSTDFWTVLNNKGVYLHSSNIIKVYDDESTSRYTKANKPYVT